MVEARRSLWTGDSCTTCAPAVDPSASANRPLPHIRVAPLPQNERLIRCRETRFSNELADEKSQLAESSDGVSADEHAPQLCVRSRGAHRFAEFSTGCPTPKDPEHRCQAKHYFA